MTEKSENSSERRTFLGIMLGGISAVIAAAFVFPLFRYLSPRNQGTAEEQVRIPRQQIQVGGAHFFTFRGRPAVVLEPKAGEFIALSAVCTHLGCIVKWESDKDEFLCPCHGGRYSPAGQVLSGPPPAPLPTYSVSVAADEILIG